MAQLPVAMLVQGARRIASGLLRLARAACVGSPAGRKPIMRPMRSEGLRARVRRRYRCTHPLVVLAGVRAALQSRAADRAQLPAGDAQPELGQRHHRAHHRQRQAVPGRLEARRRSRVLAASLVGEGKEPTCQRCPSSTSRDTDYPRSLRESVADPPTEAQPSRPEQSVATPNEN